MKIFQLSCFFNTGLLREPNFDVKKIGQKVRIQCVNFGFFAFTPSSNSSHNVTTVFHSPAAVETFIISLDKLFSSLLTQVRVLPLPVIVSQLRYQS